jgi:hypothetical protein
MKTFAFFLKKNFNCSIELLDDYFIVSYKEKTYCFNLRYDYMLSFKDKEFFDLSKEVNEFTIVDFFISIIPECDFEEEIK